MDIICPFCSAKLETPPEYNGQKVQCPECSNKFVAQKNNSIPVAHKLNTQTNRQLGKIVRQYQILLSAIVLSVAVILYGVIRYNSNRYYYFEDNSEISRSSVVFDKCTGDYYYSSFSTLHDPTYIHYNFIDRVNKERMSKKKDKK